MKRYSIIIIPVLVIIAVIALKAILTGGFKKDAAKWAMPSFNQSNLITPEQLDSLLDKPLLICFSKEKPIKNGNFEWLSIPSGAVLSKKNRQIISGHKGDLVLYADDPAVSARIWMVLSQMGYKSLYILADSTGNDVLKYKFRPDIATGPES